MLITLRCFSPQIKVNQMKLYNRGSSYYVVVNVPRSLISVFKKKQIWQSLHTTDKAVATIRSMAIIAKINNLFVMEKYKMTIKGFGNGIDDDFDLKVSPSPYETYDYDDATIESFALDYCVQNINKDKKTLIKSLETLNYYNLLLKENIEAYHEHNYETLQPSVDIYISVNHLIKPSEACQNKFLQSFMLALIQYLEIMINYIKGAEINEPQSLIYTPPSLEEFIVTNLEPKTYKKADLTLIELVDVFNNELSRDNVSQAQKDKIKQRITVLSPLLNNKKIRQITSDDLQSLMMNLQWLPPRLNKDDDVLKLIKKNEGHIENTISEKTKADYIQSLKTLFNWAVKRKYLKDNTMDEVDIPAFSKPKEDNKYQTFTIEELQKLFHSELFTKHWDHNREKRSLFWVVLLGLYTGARLNEICQLEFDDIREEEGVKFLSINENNGKRVKTKAGIRSIPIHQELIKLGFFKFVDFMRKESKASNKRIFFDFKPNVRGELSAQASRWFGKYLEKIGLKKEYLVFHSFRHTVRTVLRNHNCPIDRVQRLCGWEGSNSLSEHYGTISIKVLADEFNEKLVYEGLDLSHLYV